MELSLLARQSHFTPPLNTSFILSASINPGQLSMSETPNYNPTSRFTGLAENYALHRPGYPDKALDYIQSTCKLNSKSLIADIGCGTGISSRAFAMRGFSVIGIEPNADMRAKAEKELLAAPYVTPQYLDGTAEATGLENESIDMVLSAQAFHWFRPVETLQEFHRILKPSGWCVLMWNERNESDAFTKAYGAVLRTLPDTISVEQAREGAGDALLESTLFHHSRQVEFRHQHAMNLPGLLGRTFSTSYVPKDLESIAYLTTEMQKLFADFQHDGLVTMCYETSVYLAQR